MAEPTGRAAALAELNPVAGPPEPETEQLDLLGLPKVAARTAGRPAGARNRRVAEWTDYILSRHASPLEVLAQMATADTGALAADLACSRLEAFQEKRHAATALAPYLHGRAPIAVDLRNHQVVHLTIGDTAGAEGVGAALAVSVAAGVEIVEHQEVSDGDDVPV